MEDKRESMTNYHKTILLHCLCELIPFRPICHITHDIGDMVEEADLILVGYDGENKFKFLREDMRTYCTIDIKEIKPYLRKYESLTDDEKGYIYYPLHHPEHFSSHISQSYEFIKRLHEAYIDTNCMVGRGLAIEITEQNNPYKHGKI